MGNVYRLVKQKKRRYEMVTITNAIPLDVAIQLCEEVREEAEKNWHTPSARWCWSCQQSAGGNPDNRGFLRVAGNRGCVLINALFAERNCE